MPQRCEPTVTDFTIELFRGATCSESFQFKNADGSPIDLSGKVVAFGFKGIFDPTLKLASDEAANSYGSFAEITDAVNGKFRFLITDEETETATTGTGRWWFELRDAGNVDIVHRDTIVAEDI